MLISKIELTKEEEENGCCFFFTNNFLFLWKSSWGLFFWWKTSLCIEHINEFRSIIKRIHDIAKCPLEYCQIGLFSDSMYNYFKHWRSCQFLRNFFGDLCEKYPQGFHDRFNATKNMFIISVKLRKTKRQKGSRCKNWKRHRRIILIKKVWLIY